MAKIESENSSLRDILVAQNKFYYQIPNYQRPYQWSVEQCEQLLEDLFLSYALEKESDYFCGSLVLINSSAKTYDIVDGQQRLSTFILLSKVLATLYDTHLDAENKECLQESLSDRHREKRERLSFALGFNSKKDFHYALEHFDNAPMNDNKNNYLKNAVFLKDYLLKKEIKEINDFISWLYDKVVFIKMTCPNTDMALRIFNVLNARGLPLSALDIFKAELLRQTKEYEQEYFVSRWNDLYQKCLDNDLKIERLFSLYLMYLNPVTSREKMDKRLVTWFNKLNKTPLKYLNSVEEFLNAYLEILEMQDKYAYLLSYETSDYCKIILVSSLLHYEYEDFKELKILTTKFFYQNWVAGRKTSQIAQTCCNIITTLKEKKSLKEIEKLMVKYLNDYKVTQYFKENLKDSKLYEKLYNKKSSWLKPVLILVEYFISDNPNPNYIKMDSELHIEHVLPQNPKPLSQWIRDFNELEREIYTHSLANLTLLRGKKNKEALNRDFNEKKKIYMGESVVLENKKIFSLKSCYYITSHDVCKYTEWTPKSLQKRERELINLIESVLKL
ncbi:DUF262 domain-containing protein [Helicobacter cetorum]|uniref:DUF262 domain-containing protein n=1 Tax=Helicobacter cetorum (strain ATCC BAA-540 / CCUG 52418 / MIT 99-5656) TaxID=1163745 RepID=I0ESN3_HELCM|nr:DUF262 domain-containing protein [Helicobacter cetorum]AFI05952.1 hypothetical protein HCD_04740 [Helicobacter cetorum MIT 99-5656]